MFNVVLPTNFSSVNQKEMINFINGFTPSPNDLVKYYVVHAYEIPKVGQSMMLDMDEELENNAQEDLQNYIAQVQEKTTANVELIPFVREGSFEAVIHKLDKEIELNLVVLVQTKDSAFKEVMADKNLSDLSQSLGEPIFFIPNDPEHVSPKKVVFATDLEPFDNNKDFENFLQFVQISGATLEFVHVSIDDTKNHYQQFLNLFGKDLDRFGMTDVPFTILNDKDINKALISYIESENPEMIALVERGEHFWQKWFIKQTVNVLSEYNRLPLFIISENIDKTVRK